MAFSSRSNQQIFDEVRSQWVKATPEEIVRQSVLRKMVGQLGYPRELIAVEKEIGELLQEQGAAPPQRRIDIVCFTTILEGGLKPLIVIECKDEPLTQQAIDQVIGYNCLIRAPYLSVVTPYEEVVGYWDSVSKRYTFRKGFPAYSEIS